MEQTRMTPEAAVINEWIMWEAVERAMPGVPI
jgi:hypothetical protein